MSKLLIALSSDQVRGPALRTCVSRENA